MTRAGQPPGFPALRGRSHADIERSAVFARRSLRISPEERIDGESLFEELTGTKVPVGHGRWVELESGVEDLDSGVLGEARYVKSLDSIHVALSEETYLSLRRGIPRALFSLVHEWGHAWLHGEELVQLSRIPHREMAMLRTRGPAPAIFKDTEWQANCFASAVLMPARALDAMYLRAGNLDLTTVHDRFGASLECTGYRIETFMSRRSQLLRAA